MKQRFEVLLFDVDDTLINLTESQTFAVHKIFDDLGIPEEERNYNPLCIKDFWENVSMGSIQIPYSLEHQKEKSLWMTFNCLDTVFKLSERLGIQYNDKEFLEFYVKFNDYTKENIINIPHVDKTIEILSQKYGLFIASNGDLHNVDAKLKAANIEKFFPRKNIFFASEIKHYKPSKEFFYNIMEQLNITDISKVAMVGDSYYSDVKGALNAGIQPIWLDIYNESRTFEHNISSEFILNSFEELLNIL